jgi:hypothetical protein
MAKYGKKAEEKVERAMHEMKRGELKSGRSGKKVTNPQQAIAIGLSEAREAGGKVPKPKKSSTTAKKTVTKKATAKKSTVKKAAAKKSTTKKSAGKKKAAGRSTAKKSAKATAGKKKSSDKPPAYNGEATRGVFLYILQKTNGFFS